MISLHASPSALVSLVAQLLKGQHVRGGTDPGNRAQRPVVVKITEGQGKRLAVGIVAAVLDVYEKGE